MKVQRSIFAWLFFALLATHCTKDQLITEPVDCTEAVTYDDQVQPIIDTTCSYSSCHDGAGGTGPGNFTSYAGLQPFLNASKFERRVLEQRNMPPSNAPGPQTLTEEQLQILMCWVQNNYQEN